MTQHGKLTGRLDFYVPPEIRRQVEAYAAREQRSISGAARRLLVAGLAAQQPTQQTTQQQKE